MKKPVHIVSVYTFVFLCGVCVLFTACSKQTNQEITQQKVVQAQLGQAKHFDVPVPVSFKLVSSSFHRPLEAPSDFMQYIGSLSLPQTVAFYQREMELAGWDIVDLSTSLESFLYCTKPTKQCGITIRPSFNNSNKNQSTTISLFISQKA